jgi:hypothetical protein
MEVSVENTLTCLFPGVKNSSVAVKTTLFSYLIGSQEKVCSHPGTITCDACSIFGVQSWNQQNMSWCLWVYVIKGNNVFIAQHKICWDLSLNDFAKDAVGI